ncbi:hypothetical protein A5727_24100 [Mycobacterium sp. ACS4331]|nr:RDD family protein [Mycobacterium sp. ACS4331]OBF29133.1 hypothetical protein A5727_24100 [Mycobacterium sp. ACS4331]
MPGQPDAAGISCPDCGSGLPPTSRFCAVCGHTLSVRTTAPLHPGRTRGPAASSRSATAPQAHSASAPQAPNELRSAGQGVRGASFLLDLAAMMSPALPLTTAAAVLGVAEVVYIVIPVAFVAVWLWMQIWQGLSGNTFGKAMLGLRLVRADDHQPPGLSATLVRSLVLVGTFGLAALPPLLSSGTQTGLHDRISGLTVLDVALGVNPLGTRPQTTLRRTPDRGLTRVHSPIPVPVPRQG